MSMVRIALLKDCRLGLQRGSFLILPQREGPIYLIMSSIRDSAISGDREVHITLVVFLIIVKKYITNGLRNEVILNFVH